MNTLVFLVAAWLFVGLDLGLADAFQVGSYPIAPSFSIVLLVFVSLHAPRSSLLGAAMMLGLLHDVLHPIYTMAGEQRVVIGPHAIGYTIAAYTVYILRPLMYRRNVGAIVFLSIVSYLLAYVPATAVLVFRAALDREIEYDNASAMLVYHFFSALYTAAPAVVMGWLLMISRGFFAFRRPGGAYPTGGSAWRP